MKSLSARARLVVYGLASIGACLALFTGIGHGQGREVKVALIAPLSGSLAREGELMRIGAQLAVEDINAQGGIAALGGAKMKLLVDDAGDKVETAKNAAQRLVANHPDVVAGTGAWSSSYTLAITEVTERAHVPWLTLSYADQITSRGFNYVFQTGPVASSIALNTMPTVLTMAERVSGRKPQTVALLSDSSAAPQSFLKPLRDGGFDKLGVKIVMDEVFTSPLADATSIVQRMRTSKPDFLVMYVLGFSDSTLILAKMHEFGLTGHIVPVTIGVQQMNPEILKALGPDTLNGLIAVAANWSSKSQAGILPGLTKRSKEPWLGQNTISTYGDMWLIKEALERAGSTDHEKVNAALHATSFKHGEGAAKYYIGDRLAFDPAGRRIGGAVALVQWQHGQPFTVWPEQEALAAPLWPKK